MQHCGPEVVSVFNRNEYQEYFLGSKGYRCVGLTTLPPSCADCHEIWEPQPPGTLRACTVVALPFHWFVSLANLSSNCFMSFSQLLQVYFETITENVPQRLFCVSNTSFMIYAFDGWLNNWIIRHFPGVHYVTSAV